MKGSYMKKDYLKTIKTYIEHMSEEQLSDLYDIHSKLFINSKKVKDPTSYLDKTYNDFVYYFIKHSTPKTQYINVIIVSIVLFSVFLNIISYHSV